MFFSQADGIIDLRSWQNYQEGHIVDATWLSWEILPESLNALPASPASFYLVGGRDEIEAASILLDSKGYSVSGSVVINSDEDWQKWAQQLPMMVEQGKQSKILWKPSPLVTELVGLILSEQVKLADDSNRPDVLDIGCGGGRDAIFMAKNRMNVIAIDHEQKVLKRSKALANLSGANVKFKCCDIKKQDCLPDKQFDVITVVRFLNRESYDYIINQLKPGGVVLFQTFVEGVEAFGSPKNPNFILRKGELAEVFRDFDIIVDRMETLSDGRPIASFIAQKP